MIIQLLSQVLGTPLFLFFYHYLLLLLIPDEAVASGVIHFWTLCSPLVLISLSFFSLSLIITNDDQLPFETISSLGFCVKTTLQRLLGGSVI